MPKHFDYPTIPLQGLLEASSKAYPNNTALIYDGHQTSYRELNALSNRFSIALREMGVKNSDCVALYLPNIPQFVIAYFGALKAGAIVTAISPLHREREVEFQLCDSSAQIIAALDSLYPTVEKVRGKTQLKYTIIVKSIEETFSPQDANSLDFRQLLENIPKKAPRINVNPSEDLAAIQYTGGTTGTAKGAMLTHRNLVSNAVAFAAAIKATSNDTFLTALPLFHIYGLTTSLNVPIAVGATMVLLPKFQTAKVLSAIQQHHVTVFCGVPTMYAALLAHPDLGKYDLRSVRVCISGGSSLPPQVQRRFMDVTGGFLAEGYGLTEASPVTHCSPVDGSVPLKVGSIGLPLPDTEAKIVDSETGNPLAVGEVGELAIRGPQIMAGYWHQPNETALVLRDGWLLTGDIAKMDGDGYFYIVDRKKDLIKTKDYSVYPREIEDVLYEHPSVKLCAVIGKVDSVASEVPVAYIVLKEGMTSSAEELMTFVNDKVAPYKAIRHVEFRKELPISSAGKVLKRQLKEQSLP